MFENLFLFEKISHVLQNIYWHSLYLQQNKFKFTDVPFLLKGYFESLVLSFSHRDKRRSKQRKEQESVEKLGPQEQHITTQR